MRRIMCMHGRRSQVTGDRFPKNLEWSDTAIDAPNFLLVCICTYDIVI